MKWFGKLLSKEKRVSDANIENASIIETDDELINHAMPLALLTIKKNLQGDVYTAGTSYPKPWLRDTLDLGLVPNLNADCLKAYLKAIPFWTGIQTRMEPVYKWGGVYDKLEEGQISTNTQSGYYDESLMFIPAVLETYQISGDKTYLKFVRNCRDAWNFAYRHVPKDKHLIYTEPLVSSDGPDQINRRGFSTNVEALWFQATKDMGELEKLLGNLNDAEFYRQFAEEIKSEMNRELFTTSIPKHRNVPNPPKEPFGHYVGWKYKKETGEWYTADYLELDSNLRCILLGVADEKHTESIMKFIDDSKNFEYIMGKKDSLPPAARWVYGDYGPEDYASIHSAMADGRYQNQYWVPVGALAALTYAKLGDFERMNYVIRNMSKTFNAHTGTHEWYHNDGKADGSEWFQWAARTFLISLYKGYCGIEKESEDLVLNPLKGNTVAKITHMGKNVTINIHDIGRQNGKKSFDHAQVGKLKIYSNRIPSVVIKENSTINVYLK